MGFLLLCLSAVLPYCPRRYPVQRDTLHDEPACARYPVQRNTLHGKLACARFSKCAENDIFLTKNRKQHTQNPISRRESHLSGILFNHLVLSCVLFWFMSNLFAPVRIWPALNLHLLAITPHSSIPSAKNFCFSVLFFIKKKKNVPEKQTTYSVIRVQRQFLFSYIGSRTLIVQLRMKIWKFIGDFSSLMSHLEKLGWTALVHPAEKPRFIFISKITRIMDENRPELPWTNPSHPNRPKPP